MTLFGNAPLPALAVEEPLVEEAVHALRGGVLQPEVEVQVQSLQVSRLEAAEDLLIPGELGGDLGPSPPQPPVADLEAVDDVKSDRRP